MIVKKFLKFKIKSVKKFLQFIYFFELMMYLQFLVYLKLNLSNTYYLKICIDTSVGQKYQ